MQTPSFTETLFATTFSACTHVNKLCTTTMVDTNMWPSLQCHDNAHPLANIQRISGLGFVTILETSTSWPESHNVSYTWQTNNKLERPQCSVYGLGLQYYLTFSFDFFVPVWKAVEMVCLSQAANVVGIGTCASNANT